MHHAETNHLLHSVTISLCSYCAVRVPAKVLIRDESVYLRKFCEEHGEHDELLEEDSSLYLRQPEYDKPGSRTRVDTHRRLGCPYDCGICPDHEQHTCIGLLEVTSDCDLGCPVCFAGAGGRQVPGPMSLDTVARVLDAYQSAEGGKADVLQISGGEPTTHPDILEIIRLARRKKIRYVMLNTNGLRIADDPAFAQTLSEFRGGFEIYLQFDGLDSKSSLALRGRDLSAVKRRALENLARNGVPATLVATIQRGVNDHEIGAIASFALQAPAVRGVNFQPLAFFGRTERVDPRDRITRTGVLRRLENQTSGMMKVSDFVPLPCDVDRVAFCLLYRDRGRFVPLTRKMDVRRYVGLLDNTMAFYAQDVAQRAVADLCGGACSCLKLAADTVPLSGLAARAALARDRVRFATENVFRVSVTAFLDRFTFEMKAMKKECVHVLLPDLRRVPFSAYNLFHRRSTADELAESALADPSGAAAVRG